MSQSQAGSRKYTLSRAPRWSAKCNRYPDSTRNFVTRGEENGAIKLLECMFIETYNMKSSSAIYKHVLLRITIFNF